jgi:hypothetical protein
MSRATQTIGGRATPNGQRQGIITAIEQHIDESKIIDTICVLTFRKDTGQPTHTTHQVSDCELLPGDTRFTTRAIEQLAAWIGQRRGAPSPNEHHAYNDMRTLAGLTTREQP